MGIGGILPIQIYDNFSRNNKYELKITGSQKRVMKESIESAYTLATHIINSDIVSQYIKNNPNGYHIHTPNCATPKDGPSAGVAFAVAFISRILNKKIKSNIAITGEIDLLGNVLKIGGLQYKLYGAKRANINIVFVPLDNKNDVTSDFDELFCDDFRIVYVTHIREIIKEVLIDYDESLIIHS